MAYQAHYEIHYSCPKFHRRIFANLVDFLLFAFSFVLLFIGSRAVVTSVPFYVERNETLLAIRKESGLYKVNGTKSVDIVSYLDDEKNQYSAYAKMTLADQAIQSFIAYVGNKASTEDSFKVQNDYDAYRLNADLAYKGIAYFVRDDSGAIVRNRNCGADNQTYFEKAYSPFIDKQCQGYLLTLVPGYLELTKFESNILFFVEIPIAFVLAGVLVYLIPPLFFKRGRKTLGKAMYQIGLVDSRLLSCSLPRYFARWSIFFFGELCLSMFSFGIPFIISFSMMAFSKKKQGFPDYLLGLFEVDTSHDKLYHSYEEISVEGVAGEKAPVDFQPTYED